MAYLRLSAKGAVCGLALVSLAGCMKMYNLRSANKQESLKQVQQVSLYGPYNTEIFVSAKQKPHLLLTAPMGGQLSEVIINKSAHGVQIKPTRAAIPNDLRHMTLKIYVRHLSNLSIDHGGVVRIHSSRHSHYPLSIKDSDYVLLKGGAVLPRLLVDNTTNFDATGGSIYLGHVRFIGPGNTVVNDIKGGRVLIDASGPGYLKLNGTYTLVDLVQDGPNVVLLNGKINGGRMVINTNGHRTIRMHGVNFKSLAFNAYGTDKLDLSGYVGNLQASLYGNARLNGQYLTVGNAEVKTYDTAVAKLHASRRIFAFSQDTSRIDYTGFPKYRYAYAKDFSSILPISSPTPNALNKGDWDIR